jgi:2-iminobutanoate/2-iminopropanoate deaminase
MHAPIRTKEAPQPAAAYEQGVISGNMIFVSGQVANDPMTGKIMATAIEDQVTQALRNIEAILRAAGADRRDIVRCGVFLADLSDFAAMNRAYTQFFAGSLPARTTVQAGLGALRVEIDAIAVRNRKAVTKKVAKETSRRK